MSWLLLFAAGILEVVWAYSMKQSGGFTRPIASLITIVTMIASFGLLALSMRSLPLGTAYVTWTGVGAIGAFLVGVVVLGEPLAAPRLFGAAFVVTGLLLMQIGGTSDGR